MAEDHIQTENQPSETAESSPPKAVTRPDPPHRPPAGPGMEFILDIPLEITVELGRTHMVINDLLKLGHCLLEAHFVYFHVSHGCPA